MKIESVHQRLEAEKADLSGSSFHRVNLSGSRFDDVNLSGADFENVNMSGWRVHDANLSGLRIEGVSVLEMLAFWRAGHATGGTAE